MKTFKAEKGDVFTSCEPDDANYVVWCYRGDKSVDIRDYVDGKDVFTQGKREEYEKTISSEQLERWARHNDIRIEWPEDQPATVKESLTVQPLSFRDQAAIALYAALIIEWRANDDDVRREAEVADSAFEFAAILNAERERREKGADNV